MTFVPTDMVEAALRSLTHVWRNGDRQFVSVPVQYPSGQLAVIEISAGRNHAHLSDLGLGFEEASSLCTDSSFPSFAREQCRRHGLRTDGQVIHVEDVPEDQLAAAIVAVANASASAAHSAVANDAERREEARSAAIYQKVRLAFPDANVSRVLELPGARAMWSAHNVVHLKDDRLAIFEPVTNHQNSVSSKFLMFSDLLQKGGISLNAVFSDPSRLSPKAQILKEVANILGSDDSPDLYRAKAA